MNFVKSLFNKLLKKTSIEVKKEDQPNDNSNNLFEYNVVSTIGNYIDPVKKYRVNEIVDDIAYFANYTAFENAQCIYCNYQFEKEVTRKRKCPSCKKTIVIRTHFVSKKKMILKEEEIDSFDSERIEHSKLKWAIKEAVSLGASEEDIQLILNSTKQNIKFDILWRLTNQKSIEYASQCSMGLHRNIVLTMATILEYEEKKDLQLNTLLELCYIDLNGPNNTSPSTLHISPLYDPSDGNGFLAPGITSKILLLMDTQQVDINTIKELFISRANKIKNNHMPLSPESAWKTLENELKLKIS